MKRFFPLAMLFLISCQNSTSLKPLPMTTRWFFQSDEKDQGIAESWFAADYGHPRTFEIAEFHDWDGWLGQPYDGLGWYFTDILVENIQNIAIGFANIDDEATVFVNGLPCGSHSGAGQPVKMVISSALRPGSNRIAVRVKDFGGPGGLLGDVSFWTFKHPADLRVYHGKEQSPAPPDWAVGAVIYEVNLRQFTNAGTVCAFADHLPRLREMGVDVLWFMPLHAIGEKNRKGVLGSPYSIRDYRSFNPEFGSLEDFKRVVDQAHAMDFRVIIDWVANHTAWDHPWIEEHPEWYSRNSAGEIVPPVADWSDVADLNYDAAELHAAMVAEMLWWIREVDIDGFRCDVAEMVPPEFWRLASEKLGREKELLWLAEGENPSLHSDGFHVTYASKLYWLMNRLAKLEVPVSAIDDLLAAEAQSYPPGALRLRFTSNHDENSWNGSAPERLGAGARAFAVLTFTLPGVPLIYNGQEAGLQKRLQFFNKDVIEWQPDFLAEFYRSLAHFAELHQAARQGKRDRLDVQNPHVFAFAARAGHDEFYTTINFSPQPVMVELPELPVGFVEWFSRTSVSAIPTAIEMEGWGYRIFTRPADQ